MIKVFIPFLLLLSCAPAKELSKDKATEKSIFILVRDEGSNQEQLLATLTSFHPDNIDYSDCSNSIIRVRGVKASFCCQSDNQFQALLHKLGSSPGILNIEEVAQP